MSKIELASTSNTVADFSTPERLKERIAAWIHQPGSYDDRAQSSFVQSINRYALNGVDGLRTCVLSSKGASLRAIQAKYKSDLSSLKLSPSLIAKTLGCGTVGGLAATQLATQLTLAIATCATPAGWIGGTGIAVVYYQFDRRDQVGKIQLKALLAIEKTERVIDKLLSLLAQRRSALQLNDANTNISKLNETNANLNSQIETVGGNFNTATGQITQYENSLAVERSQVTLLQGSLNTERGRITTLQNTQRDLQTRNTNLSADLDTARNRITNLEGLQTTANGQLVAAQTRISSLDGNVAALQGENHDLRASLTANQTHLMATASRVDKLQRINELNLASVLQMNRDLIAEVRADFESRERSAAAKQIADRGIEKALRREQEDKICKLNVDLARKSAAFEVLQSEHDQMANPIGHKFDGMTQAMSCNVAESQVSELLRSNQQILSDSISENNSDFIEVAQEM